MEDMITLISAEVVKLLGIVLTGLFAWITATVTKYFKNKGVIKKIEAHKNLASIIVNAVEQTYKEYNGGAKLEIAKLQLLQIANKKGIKISEEELDVFVENAVKEMNKAFDEEMNRKVELNLEVKSSNDETLNQG